MKLILYGIMGFDVCLTAAGEKVLNRSSFIVELCRYLILQAKDSCCSIVDFFVVTILFCVLWLDSYVLKCQKLLLNMILRVCIFSTTTVKNAVWSSFVNVKFQVMQSIVCFFVCQCQALDFIVFLCVYVFSRVFCLFSHFCVYTCFFVMSCTSCIFNK